MIVTTPLNEQKIVRKYLQLIFPFTLVITICPLLSAADGVDKRSEITKAQIASQVKLLARSIYKHRGDIIPVILSEINKKTTTKSGTIVKSTPPIHQSVWIVSAFSTHHSISQSMSNTIGGWTIPGRTVDISIEVDVEVQVWMDVSKIRVLHDKNGPKFELPEMKIKAVFPENVEAKYHVCYGTLRSKYIDLNDAKELRRHMYATAQENARIEMQNNISVFRQQLLQDLANLHSSKN